MQPRFDKRVGTGPFSLVEQPRFRAGFDFLRLRGQTGEVEEELAHWWETFSMADDDHRQDMVDAQRKAGQPKGGVGSGKARRVKKTDTDHPDTAATGAPAADTRFPAPASGGLQTTRPAQHRSYGSAFAPESDGDEADGNMPDDADGRTEEGATAPAKKRRRRRRKPGGGGSGGEGASGGSSSPVPD